MYGNVDTRVPLLKVLVSFMPHISRMVRTMQRPKAKKSRFWLPVLMIRKSGLRNGV